jgi:hypothetical protein
MDQEVPEQRLVLAAQAVCHAIETHARTVLDDPYEVASVVKAAVALQHAVLTYEERLMSDAGWSNPIRHLGRLPQFTSEDLYGDSPPDDAARVRVVAKYVVAVKDEELLSNLVEGRWGDRPSNVEEAVRFLYESDSWDVAQYPPGRIRLLEADLDISSTE